MGSGATATRARAAGEHQGPTAAVSSLKVPTLDWYDIYIFVLPYAGFIGLIQLLFDGQIEWPIRDPEVDVCQ